MNLSLRNTDGTRLSIDFPQDLYSVPISNKVDFDIYREHIGLWLKDQLDNETLHFNGNYYLFLCTEAISKFLVYKLNEVFKVDLTSLVDADGELLPHVLKEHLETYDSKTPINYHSLEINILTLYNLILKLIDSYKFNPKMKFKEFNYKNKTYDIPHVVSTMFDGTKKFSKINVTQLVEVLEIKKFLSNFKFNPEELDNMCDTRYTAILSMFSVLVQEKNTEYPSNTEDFNTMVKTNMATFSDIDTGTVLDVLFFLTFSLIT